MLKAALRDLFERFRERLLVGVVREEQIERLYDQLAGMMQIQSALGGGTVLKPMRQWALSPDAMAIILAELQDRARPRVVEFGCGQSTVIFASWMRQHGGSLRSFEHDPVYAETIRRQLEACGLLAHVELEIVPLVDHPATSLLPAARSYALPAAADAFDVALIDGPPSWAGEATRYHPLVWAIERLNDAGAAYLDDAARLPERRILDAVARERRDVAAEELRAEKGLVRLGKRPPA